MRIGLTYDLRDDYRALGYSEEALAEFDSPETIEELEATLQRLGFQTDRIGHVRALAERLVRGETWDLVFNIAEGVQGRSREAQVPALLEAYGVPYLLSDPLTCAATLDKAVAKRLVRDAGIATAAFAVFESGVGVGNLPLPPFPLFVKPLAEGTGKGCEKASKVTTDAGLRATVKSIHGRFAQPAIAEQFLSGREFTIGIIGNGDQAEIVAIMEILLPAGRDADVYSFINKEECEAHVKYALASDPLAVAAGAVALAAYRTLQCRDAARVDIRADANDVPHFLEVNPLPGLHPTHSDLPILAALAGVSYDRLIGRIVDAGLRRHGLANRQAA